MTVHSEEGEEKSPARRRSRRYIPNLAEFYFTPAYDWTIDEAKSLYDAREAVSQDIALNTVLYEDCIEGMRKLPEGSIDLVIADPPFGIDFDGTRRPSFWKSIFIRPADSDLWRVLL